MQTNLPHFQLDVRPQLQTTELSLAIGKRELVTNLNWQVNSGECWCIIGRNGAGKTTLLRSLAGLLNADTISGSIEMHAQPLNTWSLGVLAKVRSYLPQGRSDVFAYRVIDNVLGARHPYSDGGYWDSEQDVAIAHAALAELDVVDLAERDLRSLSAGERQRVAIAALLAQDAQLMLLDEPTTALDLTHQISTMHLFSHRCQSQHKAVVMVSHDLNLSYQIATHALLLMGDGSWKAGVASETMTPSALSACLGHPIETIWHDNQCIFFPTKFTR